MWLPWTTQGANHNTSISQCLNTILACMRGNAAAVLGSMGRKLDSWVHVMHAEAEFTGCCLSK